MIVTTICPKCDSKIKHNEEDTPRRCVGCKTQFVKAEDVVVIGNPATIVQVQPLAVNMEVSGLKEE